MAFDDDDLYLRPTTATQRRTYREHPFNSPRKSVEFLNQDKFWVNGQLERVRIKEMDSDYLMATMTLLLNRATAVFFQADLYMEMRHGPITRDSSPYHERMMATPLFQRMLERYKKLTHEVYFGVREP